MQDQVDALAAFAGRDFDEVDQAIQKRASTGHRFAIAGDNLRHAVNLLAVVGNDRRMRDHRFDFGHIRLRCEQGCAPRGQLVSLRLQLVRRDAGNHCIGDAIFLLVNLGQLSIEVGAACDQVPAFLGPCQAEFFQICGDDIRMQQVTLDRGPDAALQNAVGDGRTVAAGSGLAKGAASPSIGRNDDDRPAATAAAQLAGKEARFAPPRRMAGLAFIQARLNLRPCLSIDDTQLADFLTDLVGGSIHAGNTLAGVWVFSEGLPVIDDFADIQAIVQDAVAALAIADNRVRAPFAAAW
uniref:hypothetical protein n=1 Tax=Erythrobacter sp. EC-HK427 TaxID=2038396 RepID=UPI001F337279|nr:hypothetical protein [Erythrobacter sp. EC-HK427]